LATAAAVTTAALPRVASADPTPVRVIGFFGAGTLPYWIAGDTGLFAHENLAVTLTQTPGSVYMFNHLSAGDFDVALAAIDNIIAYDEGQGEAPLPNPADFVAFMGGDGGFLSVWARPEITTFAGLRGKPIALDALTTGYAFVMYKMLAQNGLTFADYTRVAVGGTKQRLDALLAGSCAATLLSPPFDLAAKAAGYTLLGSAVDVIGPYQATCSVARRTWLAANPATAVSLVRAVVAATAWMYDPAHRTEAIAILAQHSNITVDAATPLFAKLIDPKSGVQPQGALPLPALRTVLALRNTYGAPKTPLTDPLKYYDGTYYRRAGGTG
jgi:ABC-type nitrate/sulfonate/bicarbonate transport system substrate-binding protein